MEKVNELLGNLKERFSNPLIFSFVCSWIIINWEITLSLIWYDNSQIENTGSVSIYDFISSKINAQDGFWKPFIFAILYTFLMPIIKNLIRAFNAWTSKWGENWSLNISKGGKISIDKYIGLRENYEYRSTLLEEVINKENEYMRKYSEMENNLLACQNDFNNKTSELNLANRKIRDSKNMKIIEGSWENNYSLPDGTKGTEIISIDNGRYHVHSKFSGREYIFDIKDFYYDSDGRSVFFVKEIAHDKKNSRPKTEHININRLQVENEDLLTGYENGNVRIEYRRKEKLPDIE